MALKILLETFECDVPWSAKDQNPKKSLNVMAETRFLSQQEEHGLRVYPHGTDWDKKQPKEKHASLKMDRDVRGAVTTSERLRSERI